MKKQLTEIVKGSLKGLISAPCSASIIGLPAADGLYESINTKEGKIAYAVSGTALILTTLATIYSIRN